MNEGGAGIGEGLGGASGTDNASEVVETPVVPDLGEPREWSENEHDAAMTPPQGEPVIPETPEAPDSGDAPPPSSP